MQVIITPLVRLELVHTRISLGAELAVEGFSRLARRFRLESYIVSRFMRL